MKRHFFSTLLQTPRLKRADIWLTILPILLWYGSIQAVPHVIQTRCASQPALCAPETVNPFDRYAISQHSAEADANSYFTQNLSGALAVAVPVVLAGVDLAMQATPAGVARALVTDLVIWTQTVSWNGFFNESVKILVQRPRPFVYTDAVNLGKNPANYVSFYSGHTSFAAASCTALLLILLGRGANLFLIVATAVLGPCLIFATGLFRILAGRHFLSDVVVAAAAGIAVALVVAYLHRKTGEEAHAGTVPQ